MADPERKASKARSKADRDFSFQSAAYVPLPDRARDEKRALFWPLAALAGAGALAAAASHFYPYRSPAPREAPAPVAAAAPVSGPIDLELLKQQKKNIKVIDRYNPFIRRNYPGRGLESNKVQFVGIGENGDEIYSVVPPDGYAEKVRLINQSRR